jgi:NADH-quinone oxidoreductase subunit N
MTMPMIWFPALPEIVLILSAMVILLFGVFRTREWSSACASNALAVLALLGSGVALWLVRAGGVAFWGGFTLDRFTVFAKTLILLGSGFSLVLARDHLKRAALDRFEFPVLVLFATSGMMVMVSAANLITLYMGLELQSLSIYVLTAFARDDLRSSEAGLKYFVLGSLASGLLLYGISLVYGFTGGMDFTTIAHAPIGLGVLAGMGFVLAALAFKLSAVPFHMWTPDVYEGAPTPVTAFMSAAPKVAAITLLLRVMLGPFHALLPEWRPVVIVFSIASMLLGALAAIGQRNIKRLMAYSSIGHVGYALLGLAAGTAEGVRGVLIYMLAYIGMSLGGFACILAMRRGGRALEGIADLNGLARTDPAMAAAMAVILFGMAGIPPFSGFFGKLFVFQAAADAGLWKLAVAGVLISVVGAFYYLRIIKFMYVDTPEPRFDARPLPLSFVGGVATLFTLFFLLGAGPIIALAESASAALLR